MVVTEFIREVDCVMVGGIREGYEDIRLQTRPLKLRGKEAVRPQLSRKSCAVIICVYYQGLVWVARNESVKGRRVRKEPRTVVGRGRSDEDPNRETRSLREFAIVLKGWVRIPQNRKYPDSKMDDWISRGG